MKDALTHAELVKKGSTWLFKRYPIVITEVTVSGENPDVIGWSGGYSCLLEAKATRSDFLSDAKKYFRHKGGGGVGTFRYYIANSGIIKPEELPEKWGLLEVRNSRIFRVADAKPFEDANHIHEKVILLSLLRRVGQIKPQGVSINAYYNSTADRATLCMDIEEECSLNIKEP